MCDLNHDDCGNDYYCDQTGGCYGCLGCFQVSNTNNAETS